MKMYYSLILLISISCHPNQTKIDEYTLILKSKPSLCLEAAPPLRGLLLSEERAVFSIDKINDVPVNQYTPQPVPISCSTVTISGWALDILNTNNAAGVYIHINGKDFPTLYGIERMDVSIAHNNLLYLNSGFLINILTSDIGTGIYPVYIKVIDHSISKYFLSDSRIFLQIL